MSAIAISVLTAIAQSEIATAQPQIAPPPPPSSPVQPPPPPSRVQPASPSSAMPPNQPSSLNEPVWVMPTTVVVPSTPPAPIPTSQQTLPTTPALTTSPQQVIVPKIEPPPPPGQIAPSQTGAPVRSANPNDLALFVTDVQIAGVAPDLQEFGLQAIQTKPGGQVTSAQLESDVTLLLNTGFFSSATVSTRPNAQGVSVTFSLPQRLCERSPYPVFRRLLSPQRTRFLETSLASPLAQRHLIRRRSKSTTGMLKMAIPWRG